MICQPTKLVKSGSFRKNFPNFNLVGVPESGIEDAVQKLLARGYKVGRMEQIETAERAKAERGSGATVQRRLVHVSTPSTAMDDNLKPEAVHLIALKEGVGSAMKALPKRLNLEFGLRAWEAAGRL
eukprot:Gb_18996 [translate_table: standard]